MYGSSFLQQRATRKSLTVEEALAEILQPSTNNGQNEEDDTCTEDSSEGREGSGKEYLPVIEEQVIGKI